jgi:very-short-patch-repair endonuclease
VQLRNMTGPSRATQNYFSLPCNVLLRERARELRKAGNLAEVLLWQRLKDRKAIGLDFDRQKIIGNYIVGFYCPNVGLVVEVDGASHDDKEEYDRERNMYLCELGLEVLHVTDVDVKHSMNSVVAKIQECIKRRSAT